MDCQNRYPFRAPQSVAARHSTGKFCSITVILLAFVLMWESPTPHRAHHSSTSQTASCPSQPSSITTSPVMSFPPPLCSTPIAPSIKTYVTILDCHCSCPTQKSEISWGPGSTRTKLGLHWLSWYLLASFQKQGIGPVIQIQGRTRTGRTPAFLELTVQWGWQTLNHHSHDELLNHNSVTCFKRETQTSVNICNKRAWSVWRVRESYLEGTVHNRWSLKDE